MRRSPLVLFAAAAGPEMGFGHLVRAAIVAETLRVRPELVLRGSPAARLSALRRGWVVHEGRDIAAALLPDLIVVDDPSTRERDRWIRRARRHQVPVAAFCDAETAGVDADLVIDGSVVWPSAAGLRRCQGPAWAALSPAIAARRRKPLRRDANRVLVALGGGVHVGWLGVRIAEELAVVLPGLRVDLAAGFIEPPSRPLPRGCRWVQAPLGLADHLSAAAVAVVAGGLTMYEACALGVPTVAVPVVDAQRPAIAAAAAAGAVVTVSNPRRAAVTAAAVAAQVAGLMADRTRATALGARAAGIVDGLGASRLATRLLDLVRIHAGGTRHAA